MTRRSLVLVVDDMPVAREAMEALLAKEPYDLAFAGDGHEALAQAQALTPDVVLLDIMMPGIDGYEVCRRIRTDARLREVPIVMLTALDDRDSRLRGIEAGADDFITKPFDRVELRARLRTILRLNRYRRLSAERALNRWVVEHADVGYAIVDDDDRVVYLNPLAQLYLGVPAIDPGASPGTFTELAARQYRAEPEWAWRNWAHHTPLLPEQPAYLVRPETDVSRAFWLRVTTLDRAAGPDGRLLICLRDVTDEMNAYCERSAFEALVMHKLRSPLTHVRSSAELLGDATLAAAERHTTELALRQGIETLCGVVDDIARHLGALRMASARTELLCLRDLAAVVAAVSGAFGLHGARLTLPGEIAGRTLRLSPAAVEWLMWELVDNAVKFHPLQRPAIEVTVERAGQGAVAIRVSDDGVSLSPEQLAKAWTPYYQGERYVTGSVGGLGLGLPSVAVLVWGVGGKCRLLNRTDGPGLVVELLLPLGDGGPAPAGPP